MRKLVGCVLLLCSCGIDDAGVLASDMEIVVSHHPTNPALPLWLFEVPLPTGFYSADRSSIYSQPTIPGAFIGDIGAAAAVTGQTVLAQATPIVHPVTGRLGGTTTIANLGPGWLYEALVWSLEQGRAYDAVYFQPVPGQPVPDGTVPITTFLAVCPYSSLGAINSCRSWPGAVRAGWVTCRDAISKAPISIRRCEIMAPYTSWYVHGPRPGGGPVLPSDGVQDILYFLSADAMTD